ncbi:unnamed protein product [Plutella xylostella]|uniref:(diamondback moth) hypothetical protein n=1 Tax=Plutella xylostella TaxID=51655 RepID=A0A8S4DCC3_PLUXY|nr:unnamed protein product [Plutella xylostella]
MPCESCAVQFSVFRRRRACGECERWYCAGCLRRGGGSMCAACRALSTRPLARASIAHLKVRDLQAFLQRQNVSTRGCVEKEELVSLCVSHVNGAGYRRRGSRGSSAFSSLKGFTSNINELINHAFDLRPSAHPAPAPADRTSRSSARGRSDAPRPAPPPDLTPEQPTCNPRHRSESVPAGARPAPPPAAPSRRASLTARVDTADCFEVEDLDDSGWEFVVRPADPLPNDSEVLLERAATAPVTFDMVFTVDDRIALPPPPPRPAAPPAAPAPASPPASASPQRAASELDLRRSPSDADTDTASLKDEPMFPTDGNSLVELEDLQSESELEQLSVRQLKLLLENNRVQARDCLERGELRARARQLYRDHRQQREQLESLPLEECCKICMAAPLECVLLECGHVAACTRCGKRLAECPICRRYVTRAVRFFR